jgi:tRNA (guanine-N7-)-methyltransferase
LDDYQPMPANAMTTPAFTLKPGAPAVACTLAPAQGGILIRLQSLVTALDPHAAFSSPAPVEIELGSGDGGFLMDCASQHPERNFLGIERFMGRIRKLERKAPRRGLTNLRGLRIEAMYFLEYLLPADSVSVFHVYFPDPWPKKRHRSRRLVNVRFAELAHRALVPGGLIYLRTDDADYHAQMLEVLSAHAGFRETTTPDELASLLTDFERDFLAQGKPTRRAAYQRRC